MVDGSETARRWVKICANTNVDDALRAAELGADAVGFVFAPSVRRVTVAEVKLMTEALPAGVEKVGVFGVGTAEAIAEAADEAGLDAVQLHGGVDLEFARRLRKLLAAGLEIIQTVHWSVEQDGASAKRVAEQLAAIKREGISGRVLVDARVGASAGGGTGRSFDWESAREVLRSQPGLRVIVAGGLAPENVAEAIRVLGPWGVDVASGVESGPGRKDWEKLRRFIENARRA